MVGRRFILILLPIVLTWSVPHIAMARGPSDPALDPVIAAAGDIACDPTDPHYHGGVGDSKHCHMTNTGNQVENGSFGAVLALGDTQYECGGLSAFNMVYAATWGKAALKAMTHPAIGNHEYDTSGGTDCDTSGKAGGYFGYFGAAAGDPTTADYSFDVGTWHLIALNSNCHKVSCSAGSAQETWLKADLAAHSNTCTLAFYHHSRFSSGRTGWSTNEKLLPFWNDLYAAHADVVLNGHHHFYERMKKLDPRGNSKSDGIRQLTVGTGGINNGNAQIAYPGSEFRDWTHFGILKLTLHPSSYDWAFVSDDGTVLDSGTDACV
jgi:hypothetical protein